MCPWKELLATASKFKLVLQHKRRASPAFLFAFKFKLGGQLFYLFICEARRYAAAASPQVMVVAKADPFPPLSSVTLTE